MSGASETSEAREADEHAPALEELLARTSAREAARARRDEADHAALEDVTSAPCSVLYGGAHLFGPGAFEKLGDLARRTFAEHVRDDDDLCAIVGDGARPLATEIRARVGRRLEARPLDDVRVDFEDGYGARSDADEDADADRVGAALAEGHTSAPRWLGIRTKPFDGAGAARAARTLLRVLRGIGEALPKGFVVTLPKVRDRGDVAGFCELLTHAEASLGHPPGTLGLELMIESPTAVLDASGGVAVRGLVAAAGSGLARSRVTSVHLGAYDLLSASGVPASAQGLPNPLYEVTRALLTLSLAGTGVRVVDGATTRLPLPVHRPVHPSSGGASLSDLERAENRAAIAGALREHANNVTAALEVGVHQGWDLHPAQLVARHLAVTTHYVTGLAAATTRLRAFLKNQARATAAGQAFDDAATALGLTAFFRRGLSCGALEIGDRLAVDRAEGGQLPR